jgi:hypothetical protein
VEHADKPPNTRPITSDFGGSAIRTTAIHPDRVRAAAEADPTTDVQGHVKVRLAQPCPPPTSLASMTKDVKSWWFALMLSLYINSALHLRNGLKSIQHLQSCFPTILTTTTNSAVKCGDRQPTCGNTHPLSSIERPFIRRKVASNEDLPQSLSTTYQGPPTEMQ